MERLRVLSVVPLLGAFTVCTGLGQESYRGGDYPSGPVDSTLRVNTASILFDRNLNTYNWTGRAAIDTSANGIHVGLLQQFTANVIEFQGGSGPVPPKLQSSQENMTLLVRAPAAAGFTPRAQWSSFVYSDNRGEGLNNASSENILGGAELSPLP